jgi:hypothetical protein
VEEEGKGKEYAVRLFGVMAGCVCAQLGRAEYKRSRRDYEKEGPVRFGDVPGRVSVVVCLTVTPSELSARPPTCGN